MSQLESPQSPLPSQPESQRPSVRAVVVNPASGSGRTASRWRRVVEGLEAGGDSVEVVLTSAEGDAIAQTRRLIESGFNELVVLGGDGTVGEVIAGCLLPDGSGAVRDDLTLSIIHQGTGGDLARGLGIPKDEAGAVATALTGTPRRIDVGVAHYRTVDGLSDARGFGSTANVGMASDVVKRVTGRLKKLGNNGAFAVATVGCLARNHARAVRVRTEEGFDATLDIVDIDICNNRFMGGGMLVAPEASLDDGMFDVVMIAAAGRLRLIRTFPKIYSGTHVHDPLVRVERTRSITIEEPDGAVQQGVVLDGELVGTTPATFTNLPGAISVRVPRSAG